MKVSILNAGRGKDQTNTMRENAKASVLMLHQRLFHVIIRIRQKITCPEWGLMRQGKVVKSQVERQVRPEKTLNRPYEKTKMDDDSKPGWKERGKV